MAFFNELGKKISQTSQGVVQKTKDTAESMKLSGMVSDEEKRINGLFMEIGKKYFELNSELHDPNFEEMIVGIKNARAKIADYSEQIKRLKGVVRCPNCGGEVPYNAPFCSSCGCKMLAEGASAQGTGEVKRCAKCGVPLAEGAAFCTSCGTRVEAAAPQTQATASEPQAEEVAVPATRKCPKCGKEVSLEAKFCVGCGNNMEA